MLGNQAAQKIPDAGIPFAEHEMIGVADEVQLGRLPRALEQLDRLLGGSNRIVGGVEEQQRPRRDSADHVVGAERSEEHTSELQSHLNLVCRLLLEKKKSTR